ncbi:MAG: YceK/YidQ family lipoprotein [Planctomycetaceae bacterium]
MPNLSPVARMIVMPNLKSLLPVVASLPAFTLAGCMSVLHYHEIDGTTKTPYSGTKTDLGLVGAAVSDPEIRGTLPGVGLFLMSAIDAPLSFVADTFLLPRDLRRLLTSDRTSDDSTE